jgi:hypothetical protein
MHRNGGDRRKARHAERRANRKAKKHDKHEMHLETLRLKQSGKQSTWGTIMGAVGPVANQFIGVQKSDGSTDPAFVNEDGTVTNTDGETYTPHPNAKIHISDDAHQELLEAGADPNAVADTASGSPSNARMNVHVSADTTAPATPPASDPAVKYHWGKQDGETTGVYLKRLYADKPMVMYPATLVVVGGLVWGGIMAVKKWFPKKGVKKF